MALFPNKLEVVSFAGAVPLNKEDPLSCSAYWPNKFPVSLSGNFWFDYPNYPKTSPPLALTLTSSFLVYSFYA